MIGKEITRIGLQKHYKSHGLINMFTWSWIIDLVASIFAVCIVLSVQKFGLQYPGAILIAIISRVIAKMCSIFVDWLLLVVLI